MKIYITIDGGTTNTRINLVCGGAVTDTVKHKDPLTGFVSTPERANLFAVQTPQCFKKSLYLHAKNALCDISSFTDETSVLEEIGVEVSYIKVDGVNMKLTSPDDVPIAELLMKRREASKSESLRWKSPKASPTRAKVSGLSSMRRQTVPSTKS